MPRIIRTLILDDSAFARKVIREILSVDPFIEVVGAARDGQEGLEMAAALQPDLIITDLHMPLMDGVAFVRAQMEMKPVPILILSSASGEAAEVLDALDAGALDVVTKPSALANDGLRAVRSELVDKIRAAFNVPAGSFPRRSAPKPAPLPTIAARPSKFSVVAIGISTGGPQALRRIMPQFPADFPVPIVIVLHMPVGYTAIYAEKLDGICALEVKEAQEGDLLLPGRVLLAPAGRHLTFNKTPTGHAAAHLSMQPLEKIHRPSVDVLFKSVAQIFLQGTLAVVMTGMGDDGKEGCAWVKAQGGTVFTEAEKSCVIYGMPRSVAEAGLSDHAVALDDMVQTISTRI